VAPWRRKFSSLNVLFICYGTAVEHRSLLNRSGICDGINRCNIFFVHATVLSIKTAFNLVKIHLLSRIISLIQWSLMFCRPCFNRFGGLKYIPRLFSEYMLTFRAEEPMKICVTNYIRNIKLYWKKYALKWFICCQAGSISV
jgi:hypothetical protein